MINIKKIQSKIKDAIMNCGLTQTALANKLNISQSAVAHYLKGDIMPALDTFANLCAVLDLDANEILCINEKNS